MLTIRVPNRLQQACLPYPTDDVLPFWIPGKTAEVHFALSLQEPTRVGTYVDVEVGHAPSRPYDGPMDLGNEHEVVHYNYHGTIYFDPTYRFTGDVEDTASEVGFHWDDGDAPHQPCSCVKFGNTWYALFTPGMSVTFPTSWAHRPYTFSCVSQPSSTGITACGFSFWTTYWGMHRPCFAIFWCDTSGRRGHLYVDESDIGSLYVNEEVCGQSIIDRNPMFHRVAHADTPGWISRVQTNLGRMAAWAEGALQPISHVDVWGELSTRCVQQVKQTNVNVLSTAYEAANVIDEVTNLLETVKSVDTRDAKRFAKALGNLKLSLQWGLPLTYKDLQQLSKACVDAVNSGVFGEAGNVTAVHHAGMTISRIGRSFMDGVGGISTSFHLKTLTRVSRTGMEHAAVRWAADFNLLSMQNGWDMIPYSFVVDWFTDFSKVVQAADAVNYRVAFQDIIGSVRGERTVIPLSTSVLKLYDPCMLGTCTVVNYRRYASSEIPIPTAGFLHPSGGADHWIDGSILISQRLN